VRLKSWDSRGVTLLEGLLTLFLLSLVMVVVSDLTSTLRRANGVSETRGKLIEARSLALGTIQKETLAAVTISSPASTASSKIETLRFLPQHVVPNPSPARLVPNPTGYLWRWQPKDPAHMAKVEIKLNGDKLEHTAVDGTTRTLLLAKKFQAVQPSPGLFEYTIELATDGSTDGSEIFLRVCRW
jgi:type II secretory pathway component PulJ